MISVTQLANNLQKDKINLSADDLSKVHSLLMKLASCEYERFKQERMKANDCFTKTKLDISPAIEMSNSKKTAA